MISEEEFLTKFKSSLKKYYHDELGLPDWQNHVNKRLDNSRPLTTILKIEQHIGSLKEKIVLSVGSGWGEFGIALSNYGAYVLGIDSDIERIKISNLRANNRCKFYYGVGEELPFNNNGFDFVECSSVLEHVKDPEKVISEMIRVLKVGGCCYIQSPNYFYPTESHYKVLWIPMLPKVIAKLYLKLRIRNPSFIIHINYTTPIFFKKILNNYNNIQVLDIGKLPILPLGIGIKQKIKRGLWNSLVYIYDVFDIGNSPIELIIQKSN